MRCRAYGQNCRYPNPHIKLKHTELHVSHYTKHSEIKWIVKFCTTFKCERLNYLLGAFWKLQVKGNLFVCPQICTVASLTYKQLNTRRQFFLFLNNFFFKVRAILLRALHILLILFRKCSVTFHWNWIWQIADTCFSALGSETEEQIKQAKNKIRVDL